MLQIFSLMMPLFRPGLAPVVLLIAYLMLTTNAQVTIDREWRTYMHGVKADKTIAVSERQIKLENFFYDGTSAATRFAVGKGNDHLTEKGGELGGAIIIPDENGKCEGLKTYDGKKEILLILPDGVLLSGQEYLIVTNFEDKHIYGYIEIPKKEYPAVNEDDKVPKPERCERMYYSTTVSTTFENRNLDSRGQVSCVTSLYAIFFAVAATLLLNNLF